MARAKPEQLVFDFSPVGLSRRHGENRLCVACDPIVGHQLPRSSAVGYLEPTWLM